MVGTTSNQPWNYDSNNCRSDSGAAQMDGQLYQTRTAYYRARCVRAQHRYGFAKPGRLWTEV